VSIKHKFPLLITAALVSGALILTSCTSVAHGWAGGVAVNGDLFLASQRGRILIVDTNNSNALLGKPIQLNLPSASGISCLPSSCSSAAAMIIYASPTVQGQIMYIAGGNSGQIFGYQFDDKGLQTDPLYTYPKSGTLSAPIIGNMTLVGGNIYFATSDGNVYSLKADSLYLNWVIKIDSKIWSAPAVDGDTLYITCFNKNVYALNTSDGSHKWAFKTDGSINSTPLISDGKVYFGDYSRHFYALDAATGNMDWQYPNDDTNPGNPKNWFWAAPVEHNSIIYAANLDGNVYAMDAATGKLVNTYDVGDSISSSPIVVGDYVVLATAVESTDPKKQKGTAYIINTVDDSHRSNAFPANEDVNAPLFAQGSVVYFHTTKDNLYSLDTAAKDGQLKLLFNLSTVK
jgi:outer membrane protein assembly factor BamB